MGYFFYNMIILLFYPLFFIFSFLNSNFRNFYLSRKEGEKKIKAFLEQYNNKKKIWLHASSAGELEQALALFRLIKQKFPKIPVLITVYSLSVKNLEALPSEGKAYMPVDFFWQWNFLKQDFIFFITFTWDIFPNLLSKLNKCNTKNFLCSAALSKNSWKLKFPIFFRFLYKNLDGVGVVDEEQYNLFTKLINQDKISITGDTRYEYIDYKLKNFKIPDHKKEKLMLAEEIFILGSTYTQCEKQILPYLKILLETLPNIKIWIFPHKVEQQRIEEIKNRLKTFEYDFLLFSDKDFKKKYKNFSIIIVDELGVLAFAYSFARVCYVGGGFHHRIHNTAEPAFCGAIPITGPKIDSSPIALQLKKQKLLFVCKSGKEIIEKVIDLYKDPNTLKIKSKEIKTYIQNQLGASLKFYDIFLKKLL